MLPHTRFDSWHMTTDDTTTYDWVLYNRVLYVIRCFSKWPRFPWWQIFSDIAFRPFCKESDNRDPPERKTWGHTFRALVRSKLGPRRYWSDVQKIRILVLLRLPSRIRRTRPCIWNIQWCQSSLDVIGISKKAGGLSFIPCQFFHFWETKWGRLGTMDPPLCAFCTTLENRSRAFRSAWK